MTMRKTRSKLTQRGGAAIEFALLFFPLALLTFGITEFGRALHQYNTVVKAVRDAARYQSTAAPGNTLVARCLAVTGSAAVNGGGCSGTPLLPGLDLGQVSVCDQLSCAATHRFQETGRGVVNLVSVTVTGYVFSSMVPFAVPSITFGPVRATMVQPI